MYTVEAEGWLDKMRSLLTKFTPRTGMSSLGSADFGKGGFADPMTFEEARIGLR